MVYRDRVYIFIQLMYNKNDHLAKQSIFVRCLMSSLASTTPSPLDPRHPLHMLYMFIALSCQLGKIHALTLNLLLIRVVSLNKHLEFCLSKTHLK